VSRARERGRAAPSEAFNQAKNSFSIGETPSAEPASSTQRRGSARGGEGGKLTNQRARRRSRSRCCRVRKCGWLRPSTCTQASASSAEATNGACARWRRQGAVVVRRNSAVVSVKFAHRGVGGGTCGPDPGARRARGVSILRDLPRNSPELDLEALGCRAFRMPLIIPRQTSTPPASWSTRRFRPSTATSEFAGRQPGWPYAPGHFTDLLAQPFGDARARA
jgi:hypothetical protein